ncbi:Uncharacterised protein [Vibrio cholerae]|nr:Uncharacterised protein [Vibrio cholerae]
MKFVVHWLHQSNNVELSLLLRWYLHSLPW